MDARLDLNIVHVLCYHTNTILYIHSNIKWSPVLKGINISPFTDTSGPKVPLPSSPVDVFSLFFTPTLMKHIVDQSNLYASECMGEEKFANWMKITVDELRAYMGFMILMGLVKLPSIRDYWKKDELYHYSPIASRISRDRFYELHRYLHFADNSKLAPPGSPDYKKLGKVQPVIDSLSHSFQAVYTPGENVSVDEAMIPFKGRSSLKQYMPMKPVKRGIKVWALADASNGYISTFQVYTGKQNGTVEKGLGANVVKTLTKPYVNSHRHVYFDNFFTGIDLLLDLEKSNLYGCGTMRTNRKGFPPQLKPVVKKGMKERGESKTYQCNNLTISAWQDNKTVTIAATNTDPTVETHVFRKKDGSSIQVKCPQAIDLYNKNMGGVDTNDQFRGYYNVRLKGHKFYKYIFWFLFDVAVTNSYILCKNFTDLNISDLKSFRAELAKGLIGNYCSRKRCGRPSLSLSQSKRFCLAHFPVRGADKQHRCHYCSKYRQQRHGTVWYCNYFYATMAKTTTVFYATTSIM